MQPPPGPPRWGFRDASEAMAQKSASNSFGRATKLAFGDLGFGKDYFGHNGGPVVRGSSPSASLAADLSQNFYIDQRFALLHISAAIDSDMLQVLNYLLLADHYLPRGCLRA